MPITNYQRVLVQSSFAKLIENIDTATVVFFDQLFQIDPSLKSLFIGEMSVQGRKMIQTFFQIPHSTLTGSFGARWILPARRLC